MLYKFTSLGFVVCLLLFALAIALKKGPYGRSETIQFNHNKEPDIDMFLGNWQESAPRYAYGTLEVRDILTKSQGDPLHPTKKGAVLTDINSLSYAILEEHVSTTPSILKKKQQIFYFVSGGGIIKTEKKSADLYEGIGVIMPPGIEFSITNTGNEQLIFYIIEENISDGFTPNDEMVVKYEYDNPISTNIQRENRINKWLFGINDGLSTLVGINPVMYEPKSLYPPHVHEEGVEEVWLAVKGEVHIIVGKQRRRLPAGSAYKVPANGTTPHTTINISDHSQKLLWIMKVPVRRVPTRRKPLMERSKELENLI